MGRFKASTRYGHWQGTAAADNADMRYLLSYLESKGLVQENEFLIATSLSVGENRDGKLVSVNVRAFMYTRVGSPTVKDALAAHGGTIPVRIIDLDLKLEEFIGLFKRFEVFLTDKTFASLLEECDYLPTNNK